MIQDFKYKIIFYLDVFVCFRPKKCRAYVQNLLPHLNKLSKRPEEALLETLAFSLEKIMTTLGHFTNDNEVKTLLKAFIPNLSNPSSAIRRATVNSLMSLCQHSRKPKLFFTWLLTSILQGMIPTSTDLSTNKVNYFVDTNFVYFKNCISYKEKEE